jgi:hypothetical protein
MPWYKITIASDAEVDVKTASFLAAMEAAWLIDQTPGSALYRSSSTSEHLFFASPSLAEAAKETLSRFGAVQCYPPAIARLSQVIPGPKDKAPSDVLT